jgi:hypothetical protein
MRTHELLFTDGNLPRCLYLRPLHLCGTRYVVAIKYDCYPWPRPRYPGSWHAALGTPEAALWACYEWIKSMHGVKHLCWGAEGAPPRPE